MGQGASSPRTPVQDAQLVRCCIEGQSFWRLDAGSGAGSGQNATRPVVQEVFCDMCFDLHEPGPCPRYNRNNRNVSLAQARPAAPPRRSAAPHEPPTQPSPFALTLVFWLRAASNPWTMRSRTQVL